MLCAVLQTSVSLSVGGRAHAHVWVMLREMLEMAGLKPNPVSTCHSCLICFQFFCSRFSTLTCLPRGWFCLKRSQLKHYNIDTFLNKRRITKFVLFPQCCCCWRVQALSTSKLLSPAPRMCYEMAFMGIWTESKQPTEFLKYLPLRANFRLHRAGTDSQLLLLLENYSRASLCVKYWRRNRDSAESGLIL